MYEKPLKAALRQFRILYLGSLLLLFLLLAFLAFTIEKERLISDETRNMDRYLSDLEQTLKDHHFRHFDELVINTKGYRIGLYDIDHLPIITQYSHNLPWSEITWMEKDVLYSRHDFSLYFLGVTSIVISKKIETTPILIRLTSVFVPLLWMMALVGYLLSRIALKPARNAFETVDTFIKHATHDLNTPIAAILSNARILEEKITEPSLQRFVQRISIGAKTLTGLYEDLVYLNFRPHPLIPKPEGIKALIHEQLSLLETLIEYKKLSVMTDLSEIKLTIYADDFHRLLNNLLTNAIKYNKPKGLIVLTLTCEYLSIKDSGIGLSEVEKQKIHERYWRGESFETGLGIGMEIVIRVCKTYNLTLEIHSAKNQGSEFIIRWPKSLIA
ncbi:MAG: HAMP domain-containing sensor histidine kinase [Sulfuricurvum sp.]|nr:HAMP domain-containing sensor histidine kinase [Sulfuricurvum sp.]MDD5386110.1 HAMP domain-containing sensor histidine kinase [Sulfuricurvum sp.]